MNNETILPCPFCGEMPEISSGEWCGDNFLEGYYLQCTDENCQCQPRIWDNYLTETEAIKLWNTRTDKQGD